MRQDNFWQRVNMLGDCWVWLGPTDQNGYGQLTRNGRIKKAHRYAYEQSIGEIPAGLSLDHLCRVRECVRPSHLEPVTTRENVLRGVGPTAINAAKDQCVNGHPFDKANTQIRPGGGRRCRACHRDHQREYRRRHRDGEVLVLAS